MSENNEATREKQAVETVRIRSTVKAVHKRAPKKGRSAALKQFVSARHKSPLSRTVHPSSNSLTETAPTYEFYESDDFIDLSWYSSWISDQRNAFPDNVKRMAIRGQPLAEDPGFRAVWDAILTFVRTSKPETTINEIVSHLEKQGIFDDSDGTGPPCDVYVYQKRLVVFAILGWQSFAYQPNFNGRIYELAIHHCGNGPSWLDFRQYHVDLKECDSPLHVFVSAFGSLLPDQHSMRSGQRWQSELIKFSVPSPRFHVESGEQEFSWTPLYPDQINAYTLHSLLGIKFRWVSSLWQHLDYDEPTRTITLFSFPSICALQLRNSKNKFYHRMATFAFASSPFRHANRRDIEGLLEEILLSYRMLFGQSAQSRKFFRLVYDQDKAPFPQPDMLLLRLCLEKHVTGSNGRKDVPERAWLPRDQRVYHTAKDFPVLYRRLEFLASEMNYSRPTSMKGLLRDRRDTLQFWTFWLVGIIGGLSIVLSLVQIILQAVQIWQSAK